MILCAGQNLGNNLCLLEAYTRNLAFTASIDLDELLWIPKEDILLTEGWLLKHMNSQLQRKADMCSYQVNPKSQTHPDLVPQHSFSGCAPLHQKQVSHFRRADADTNRLTIAGAGTGAGTNTTHTALTDICRCGTPLQTHVSSSGRVACSGRVRRSRRTGRDPRRFGWWTRS